MTNHQRLGPATRNNTNQTGQHDNTSDDYWKIAIGTDSIQITYIRGRRR